MTVMQNLHGSEILSSEEMKKIEKLNFREKDSFLFMQKAGYQVYRFIADNFKKKQSIIVLCGPGNNGGDGFVISKHLMDKRYKVKTYVLGDVKKYKGDAAK